MHKEYIFNKKIPHYTCLCEVCENVVLMSKGMGHACKTKTIPTDPHTIVEYYSCNESRNCMMGFCNGCCYHGLTESDFSISESESGSDTDVGIDSTPRVKFLQWKKNETGYLTKMEIELEIDDALEMWQEKVITLKKHIYTKRQQQAEFKRLKEEIKENEIIIYLDYSENYKSQHQNEIQSAYFGHTSFSLFTACTYYRTCNDKEIEKIPITITTEANDKSRITAISCVNMVINHSIGKIVNNIEKVIVVSDGCAAQFRSKYVFMLLTTIQPDLSLEWHYNEAHHGKGPMDGIGGTVKNMVYRRVLAGDIVINNPKQFVQLCR